MEYDADAAIDSQGQVIGDYVLGKTIGRGTFGKVKIGMHLSTGEKVAVKILEKSRILEIADAERVSREIKILKRNFHSNVIQLYQVIDTSEAIYLVMEYIDGGEMFEYIVKHHRIREKEAVYMFLQIVEALEYLHKNDVTHRDLKPENLLLQATPSGIIVKVVDFGLSNTHEGGRLLQTACGSPCYAAPEMIEGKLYVGPKADIWSLGVILFAMVCGYLPFEDNNTSVLYKKILSGQYKAPNYISPVVQDLIRKILETNPEKRYTLEDIRNHPWSKSLEMQLPPNAFVNGEKVPNTAALAKLEELGLRRELVIDAIQKGAHSAFSAAYYLMLNKVNRPTEPAVRRRRYSAYNQGGKKSQATSEDKGAVKGQERAPKSQQPKQQTDIPTTAPNTAPTTDIGQKPNTTTPNTVSSKDTPQNVPVNAGSKSPPQDPVTTTAQRPPAKPSPTPLAPIAEPTIAQEPSKVVTSPTVVSAKENAIQGAKPTTNIQPLPTTPSKSGATTTSNTPMQPTTPTTSKKPLGMMEPIVPATPPSQPGGTRSGRSGKNLVESSGSSITTSTSNIQPTPPSETREVAPKQIKGRATIAMGNVLAPLVHQQPALAIATQSKNLMPFNSNATPVKPQTTETFVQKKRASRHGSIMNGHDLPTANYDLEMMKMLVNRETYGTSTIKEESHSKEHLLQESHEGELAPNASTVQNVIKASASIAKGVAEEEKMRRESPTILKDTIQSSVAEEQIDTTSRTSSDKPPTTDSSSTSSPTKTNTVDNLQKSPIDVPKIIPADAPMSSLVEVPNEKPVR